MALSQEFQGGHLIALVIAGKALHLKNFRADVRVSNKCLKMQLFTLKHCKKRGCAVVSGRTGKAMELRFKNKGNSQENLARKS